MNFLDLIFFVLLGLAFFAGFRKGLIIGLATLAALIFGTWAGFYFSDLVSGLIEKGFDYHGKYINIISFLIIFASVIVLVRILGHTLTKGAKAIALGWLNKLTGGVFGILKAAVILSVVIYFMNRFDEDRSFIPMEMRQNSMLFPVIEGLAPVFIPKMKEYTSRFPEMPDWQEEG